MSHYRYVKCYFPRPRTIRDCDTVTFFPTTLSFPEIKLDDFLRQAASDIITILTLPPSTTTPSLQTGDPVRNILITLETQLNRTDNIPQQPTPTAPPPRMKIPITTPWVTMNAALPRVQTSPASQLKNTPASGLLSHKNQAKNYVSTTKKITDTPYAPKHDQQSIT